MYLIFSSEILQFLLRSYIKWDSPIREDSPDHGRGSCTLDLLAGRPLQNLISPVCGAHHNWTLQWTWWHPPCSIPRDISRSQVSIFSDQMWRGPFLVWEGPPEHVSAPGQRTGWTVPPGTSWQQTCTEGSRGLLGGFWLWWTNLLSSAPALEENLQWRRPTVCGYCRDLLYLVRSYWQPWSSCQMLLPIMRYPACRAEKTVCWTSCGSVSPAVPSPMTGITTPLLRRMSPEVTSPCMDPTHWPPPLSTLHRDGRRWEIKMTAESWDVRGTIRTTVDWTEPGTSGTGALTVSYLPPSNKCYPILIDFFTIAILERKFDPWKSLIQYFKADKYKKRRKWNRNLIISL